MGKIYARLCYSAVSDTVYGQKLQLGWVLKNTQPDLQQPQKTAQVIKAKTSKGILKLLSYNRWEKIYSMVFAEK